MECHVRICKVFFSRVLNVAIFSVASGSLQVEGDGDYS